MREKEVEKYLCKTVERLGGTAFKFTSPMNRGVADRVVCLPDGTVWFIEVKAPDGTLSALQDRFGQRMKELKQNYAVLYTKEEVDEWIRRVLERMVMDECIRWASKRMVFGTAQ